MKNPVESGTTVNSDSRENPIYEVTCGVPSEFTDAELEKCIAIVKAGDAVVPGSVARTCLARRSSRWLAKIPRSLG